MIKTKLWAYGNWEKASIKYKRNWAFLKAHFLAGLKIKGGLKKLLRDLREMPVSSTSFIFRT